MIHKSSRRDGVALIMAMIILAALLLLGLPFLFMQTSSMASARRFEALQAARIYEMAARNLGITLASRVTEGAYKVGANQQIIGSLHAYLNNETPPNRLEDPPESPWYHGGIDSKPASFVLKPSTTAVAVYAVAPELTHRGAPAEGVLTAESGVIISDDSDRQDANGLGPEGWAKILADVGITNDVDDSVLSVVYPGYPVDDDSIGQLAQGLAQYCAEKGRYVQLEDLLRVEPKYTIGSPGYTGSTWPSQLHGPLNRAELERLRGKLTFSRFPVGRSGLLDIGSVVVNYSTPKVFIHDLPPDPGHQSLLLAADALIELDAASGKEKSYLTSQGSGFLFEVTSTPGPADGLFRYLPAPVKVMRKDDLLSTLLPYEKLESIIAGTSSPVTAAMARSPVDLLGTPVFRFTSAATIRDRSGAMAAQQRSESVIQVVPTQEDYLELRWRSQAEWLAPIAHGWSNRVVSWPNPFNRVVGQEPDYALTTVGTGGVTAVTLPTQADTKPALSGPVIGPVVANNALGENIEWRAPFGRGVIQEKLSGDPNGKTALDDNNRALSETELGFKLPEPTDLTPEGWTIRPGHAVAYRVGGNSVNAPTPLGSDSSVQLKEMGAFHLSFWVQRVDSSTSTDPITLCEMRSPSTAVGSPLLTGVPNANGLVDRPSPGSNASQNYFSLVFDPEKNVLALIYAPPSIEETGANTWSIASDKYTTAAEDEMTISANSGSLPGFPLFLPAQDQSQITAISRLLKVNQIASLTYVGDDKFKPGMWHQVHLVIGSANEKGMAVWLDGNVGRDVTNVVSGYKKRPGDRCFWPALVTTSEIPMVPKLSYGGPTGLNDVTIQVDAPAFYGEVLTAPSWEALLPPNRGVIRINDEYMRYNSVTGTGPWRFKARRGVRQNTTDNSDWPGTQAHPNASLALGGGFRSTLGSGSATGTLYAGGVFLGENFDPPPTETVTALFALNEQISVIGNWPESGIVNVIGTLFWYEYAAGKLTLGKPVDPSSPGLFPYASQQQRPIDLASMKVSADPGANYPAPGMMQLLDRSTGTIEWIGYTGIKQSPSGRGYYFYQDSGHWNLLRNRERTQKQSIWPQGNQTLVIPVQTQFANTIGEWLNTGDILTLLPNQPKDSTGTAVTPMQVCVRYAPIDAFASFTDKKDTSNGYFAFSHFLTNNLDVGDSRPPTGSSTSVYTPKYWQVICGNGLTATRRLSPIENTTTLDCSFLPRLDVQEGSGVSPVKPGRLVIGNADIDRDGVDNTSILRIDAPFSQVLGQRRSYLNYPNYTSAFRQNMGQVFGWVVGGSGVAQLSSVSSVSVDTYALIRDSGISDASNGYGLSMIDGECFAVQFLDSTGSEAVGAIKAWDSFAGTELESKAVGVRVVKIAGRGLMGSEKTDHVLAALDTTLRLQVRSPSIPDYFKDPGNQAVYPGLAAFSLSIGPVRSILNPNRIDEVPLEGDPSKGWFNFVGQSPDLIAPYVLMVDPDDANIFEVVKPIQFNGASSSGVTPPAQAYTIPKWNRGMYNTVVQDWTGRKPIAIGWWPRYPSALPNSSTLTARDLSAQARSRNFAWVGVAAGLVGMRTTGANPTIIVDPSSNHNKSASGILQTVSVAMSTAVNGDKADQFGISPQGGHYSDWANLLNGVAGSSWEDAANIPKIFGPFSSANTKLEGLELRIYWRYANSLSTAPDPWLAFCEAGNVTPNISQITIPMRAPIVTLSTEDLR